MNKINSIEEFERNEKMNQENGEVQMSDTLATPDCKYKVVISLMKFVHIVYEFLKLIRSFPQVSFEGTSRLIEFIKVLCS